MRRLLTHPHIPNSNINDRKVPGRPIYRKKRKDVHNGVSLLRHYHPFHCWSTLFTPWGYSRLIPSFRHKVDNSVTYKRTVSALPIPNSFSENPGFLTFWSKDTRLAMTFMRFC